VSRSRCAQRRHKHNGMLRGDKAARGPEISAYTEEQTESSFERILVRRSGAARSAAVSVKDRVELDKEVLLALAHRLLASCAFCRAPEHLFEAALLRPLHGSPCAGRRVADELEWWRSAQVLFQVRLRQEER
jgi:hypothetical protein